MIISNIKLKVNKQKVLKAIKCSKESEAYKEINSSINEIEDSLYSLIEPKIVFQYEENKENIKIDNLNKCNGFYYVLLTIGKKISEMSTQYFNENDYLKGVILDAIGDDLLFSLSHAAIKLISKETQLKDINIEYIASPGDDIDIMLNKLVLDKTNSKELINVDITEGFMINPVKSSTLIIGIDTNKKYEKKEFKHNCKGCNIIECPWKEDGDIILKIVDVEREIEIKGKNNETILNLLQENNIYLNSPCGGNGTCGKCKIQVIEGSIVPTQQDYLFFSQDEINNGFRLACKAVLDSNCTINIITDNDSGFVINTEYNCNHIINSNINIKDLHLTDIDWEKETSFSQILMRKTDTNYITYNTLNRLSKHMNDKEVSLVIRNEMDIIDISSSRDMFGIGLDIGTTSIALSLVNLNNGKQIGAFSAINTQRTYGADVISRIQAAQQGKLNTLKSLVSKEIIKGIDSICKKCSILKDNIYSIVIAGNTTMIHLLLGLDVTSLGQYPFTAVTTQLMEYAFIQIFDNSLPNANITILPGISAYVGADIISGIIYTNLTDSEKPKMLIDVGTNGEIVIASNKKVLSTAAAAGPAFEGGNITCGTGSIPGAISSIQYNDKNFEYTTISNKSPIGLCGSAIIDMVGEGIKHKWIDYTGLLKDPFSKGHVQITENIMLNQADIRQIQLAKSAVRSGIECLIQEYGCSADDIEKVYLAGGFGSNINIENTIIIGMIPEEFKNKIEFVGNSSLGGTVRYMLNKNYRNLVNEIIMNSKDINLSALSNFNNSYVMNMTFENGVLE